MCCAILSLPNSNISKEHLENAFSNNDDGAGFAYIKDGKVVIEKGFFTFESFWNAYTLAELNDKISLIHFRIGTSGGQDQLNCHPWEVNEEVVMMHNGVLGEFSIKDSELSDTGLFVQH